MVGVDVEGSSNYVMNLYKCGKISVDDAKKNLLTLRDRVRHNHLELDFQKTAVKKGSLYERSKAIAAELAQEAKPFVAWPKEVCAFMEQFKMADDKKMLRRFKPLVIIGPTQVGKSAFIKSLFGAEWTYVVNCQNMVGEPYLKDWVENEDLFKTILFDEGQWELIKDNKMLFQGTENVLNLGMSKTGREAYPALLYAVPMMICSNTFLHGLDDKENKEHKTYIYENCIIYHATEKLFIDDEDHDMISPTKA